MKIIPKTYEWRNKLTARSQTKYIVLHHRAGEGDVESIHRMHLERGYSGIGYHFYVRKNGEIYRGRPIGTVGAHTLGANQNSVGICFEGNFEKQLTMSASQKQSGKEIVGELKKIYPDAKVVGHRELQSTACPGRYFPIDEVKEGKCDMTLEEAIEIVQAKSGIEDETIDFLLCYKYGEQLMQKIAEAMR